MSSLKELQDLIQQKYGIDPATLDPHASIRSAGLDSLALVEFLFEVEPGGRVLHYEAVNVARGRDWRKAVVG